jgi:hypothetical protein
MLAFLAGAVIAVVVLLLAQQASWTKQRRGGKGRFPRPPWDDGR